MSEYAESEIIPSSEAVSIRKIRKTAVEFVVIVEVDMQPLRAIDLLFLSEHSES